MSALSSNESHLESVTPLPRRDWIVLPMIGLLTACIMAASAELVTTKLFPVSQAHFDSCYAAGDPSGTAPTKPNAVCTERIVESPLPIRYQFNSQGDREDGDLEPKAPGQFRIVMLGSSFAMGLYVSREKSFAAMLPEELSRQTGRNIQLYNESTGGKFRGGPFPIEGSELKFQRALIAEPDMILWVITPMDIENSNLRAPGAQAGSADDLEPRFLEISRGSRSWWSRLEESASDGMLWRRLRSRWDQSRTSVVLEHYLIASESPDRYVESYLQNGKDADFLKAGPSAHWQELLKNFESQAAEIEKQAGDANVPLVAVLLPNRAQTAMISTNSWPPGYDPYKLDHELRTWIEDHGGKFIDLLPDFRTEPEPWKFYFPVDGHFNPQGHAAVTRMLAKELTTGAVPILKQAVHPQPSKVQGN